MPNLGGGSLPFTGSPNLSGTIDVPAGTELLIVGVFDDGGTASSTGTIGGQALSVRDDAPGWFYGGLSTRMLYYINPPTGSQTLAIAGGNGYHVAWAAWDGIDTADPFPGATEVFVVDEQAGDYSDVIASAADTEMVVGVIACNNADNGTLTAIAPGGDTIERAEEVTSGTEGIGIYEDAGATSVTVDISRTSTGNWGLGVVLTRVKLAGGGDPPPAATMIPSRNVMVMGGR